MRKALLILSVFCATSCKDTSQTVMTVTGPVAVEASGTWLSHQHVMVDFIGADSTGSHRWDASDVITTMRPKLLAAKESGISTFADATPNFLGRDVTILKELAERTGLNILMNTGLYGYNDKHLPAYALKESAEMLSSRWIREFEQGIDQTDVKPGFIKISVDPQDPLQPSDAKLVHAAALTHLQTGLVIQSHTGPATAVYPQLAILKSHGVDPSAFIWIHAQQEDDHKIYKELAKLGVWISLDGVPWDYDQHFQKILYAHEQGFLNKILISHDAGWYEVGTPGKEIKPFTTITDRLIPDLLKSGFTAKEVALLMKTNPANAFSLMVRQKQ